MLRTTHIGLIECCLEGQVAGPLAELVGVQCLESIPSQSELLASLS